MSQGLSMQQRLVFVTVFGVAFALGGPASVRGQRTASAGSAPEVAGPRPGVSYPEFNKTREITLTAVGAGSMVAGLLVRNEIPVVPPQGLDPAGIGWSVDRNAVGHASLDAHVASDWTRNAAIALPLVLALATGEPGRRWNDFGRRSVVYAETYLVSMGGTVLGKELVGRARPYTYVPADQRPDDPSYDVTSGGAFLSMPSGHTSSAWTGAALGMTEYLLVRPDAGWLPRAGIGVLGGALAGATAALRVQAGQHFPSDVLVGAGVGIVTGVVVPLLHRGTAPAPSTRAWLQMTGGAIVGTLVGVAFANGY